MNESFNGRDVGSTDVSGKPDEIQERLFHAVRSEYPEASDIELIEDGMITTAEYRAERVRIWFDPTTKTVSDVTTG